MNDKISQQLNDKTIESIDGPISGPVYNAPTLEFANNTGGKSSADTNSVNAFTFSVNLLPLRDPTLFRRGKSYESIEVRRSAVVNHFSVVLHSEIIVTIITSVELELIEALHE